MKKSNRKIRTVEIDGKTYFGYELDKNVYGERKRLYADTKEELEQKISQAEEERFNSLMNYLPANPKLKDYAELYFRNAMGVVSSAELKSEILLMKSTVYGSGIDRNITELTPDDVEKFYSNLTAKYQSDDIARLHEILKKVFEVAVRAGAETFEFDEVHLPEDDTNEEKSAKYLLSEQEQSLLLSNCLTNTKYGRNIWTVIFSLYTGIYFANILKIKNSDIHIDDREIISKGNAVPMSEDCAVWLEQKILEKAFESPKWKRNVSNSVADTDDDTITHLYNNPEQLKIFISNYLEQSPEELFFTNANGNKIRYSNVADTLRNIAKSCGLPKGITLLSVHKSFILKELNHGVSQKELRQRYGYNKQYTFTSLIEQYEKQNN